MTEKRALLIAFHFPPLEGSSGIQRTLGYARYLEQYGWQPIVLSVRPSAYENKGPIGELPSYLADIVTRRSYCLDAARHLSIQGKYLDSLAIPDRWKSWLAPGVIDGLLLVRKFQPKVIWSTYPIATAHNIGYQIAKRTGLPWVADFRDPMVETNPRTGKVTPENDNLRASRLQTEERCVKLADRLVFCTVGARDICLKRYPELTNARCNVISNGYEESVFPRMDIQLENSITSIPKKTVLLHSGTIYPTPDRDPNSFFQALQAMKSKKIISADSFEVRLRATGHDEILDNQISTFNLNDIVKLAPSIPYTDAISEMMNVSGLLIFQGYTSNPAIPAKLYEYLRARKPILAMVDKDGATFGLLSSLKVGTTAEITSSADIESRLTKLLKSIANHDEAILGERSLRQFSREFLAGELASVFDRLI